MKRNHQVWGRNYVCRLKNIKGRKGGMRQPPFRTTKRVSLREGGNWEKSGRQDLVKRRGKFPENSKRVTWKKFPAAKMRNDLGSP